MLGVSSDYSGNGILRNRFISLGLSETNPSPIAIRQKFGMVQTADRSFYIEKAGGGGLAAFSCGQSIDMVSARAF
jgi:hypothetical protein